MGITNLCLESAKYELWNMKYEIWNNKYEIWNLRVEKGLSLRDNRKGHLKYNFIREYILKN
jgi:hypothetical protein